mgnify:CR=1 FL=1
MPKGKTKKVVNDTSVKLIVRCLGRVYNSEGATLDEALSKIKIGNGARAQSLLVVIKGDSVREKILNASHTNNLFSNVGPTARLLALKWVNALFQ